MCLPAKKSHTKANQHLMGNKLIRVIKVMQLGILVPIKSGCATSY